jgi:membrane associated rhomboid family serine protease
MNRCYRHPDRETGVSCQRCDRYICPDCSTPGAVGYLCPEDAKDTIKIQRANFQKSLFASAPVTFTLIGLNVLVYVGQMLIPNLTDALVYWNVGKGTEYSTLLRAITSGFAHDPSSITHILFNMYSLFVLGTLLEPILGKIRFIIIYFLSLIGGLVAVGFLNPMGYAVYGASGAIFGLMGAFAVMFKTLRVNPVQMLVLIGVNVALSFLPGIAWAAHLGGLATGALLTATLVLIKNPKLEIVQWVVVGSFGGFLIGFFV